ncbi:sulfatase-like hydrolase/transferase [Flavobacterium sediminilitoris]|uniref:Sulfatase-like hydrolase/transferase n=1 Tax=Flavobacterium sediminilitoris TaxID=2024526 RepID=A0ABY4HR45_9FLAO|nr:MULTISPECIES: sulfatase-like hydrolase/transferase [Flavobacterium]UOX34234.1 sulfatase-like hydrolase/transferase [Flavobacterium sediminilitoris]
MDFEKRLEKLSKPDIILIITDQERATQNFPIGWEKENLHSLTFLKQNGFSFDRAFCNSCMCSPSRATLFTGTYPAQHNVTQTLTFGGDYSSAEVELSNTLPNMARMLIDDGYDVQYRGKWHLSKGEGENGLTASDVALYGFKGWEAPDAGEDTKPENFGGGFANHDKDYIQQGIAFLEQVKKRRSKGDNQPYCLVLSLVNPHDVLCYPGGFDYGYNDNFLKGSIGLPKTVNEHLLVSKKPMAQEQILIGSASLLGPLQTDEKKLNYINFYGNMLKWVDKEISFFLDTLYKKDVNNESLADKAIVFRLSDHGEMGLSHGGLRQKAFVAYEEAIRIPIIISNPILFPADEPHKSTMNLASLIDIMPTIASLTGATPPSGLRGVDLTPILKEDVSVQDAILFTYDDTKAGANNMPSAVKASNRLRCIRTKDWKFDYYFDALGAYPTEYELYDLKNDPEETTNLAYDSNYKEIRLELELALKKLEAEKLLIHN